MVLNYPMSYIKFTQESKFMLYDFDDSLRLLVVVLNMRRVLERIYDFDLLLTEDEDRATNSSLKNQNEKKNI